MPAYPALQASLRGFCPSGPGFALQLPLHARSRSRSCLRLAVRQVNVRRGLSPPSHRPCRAYTKTAHLEPGERLHANRYTTVSIWADSPGSDVRLTQVLQAPVWANLP